MKHLKTIMTQNGNEPKTEAVDTNPPKRPDWKADGVAVWVNQDKNGAYYLAIRIVGHTTIYARENKQEEQKEA